MKVKTVEYKGIKCALYKSYMAENDGPLVKILNPMDVDKAYELGFECVGHPDEIVKYISEEEYMEFSE
ncbi:MAG: hypothetical protein K6E28_05540 [Eubacterium sp.]|nr:hypothetical protein [Eubacterium sp.]